MCVSFFSPRLSPKQLNQHTQSQKRVMNLTVLRTTDLHGKMTPEKGIEDLDLGVSKRYGLPEKSVCVLGEEIQKSAVVRWYEVLTGLFSSFVFCFKLC